MHLCRRSVWSTIILWIASGTVTVLKTLNSFSDCIVGNIFLIHSVMKRVILFPFVVFCCTLLSLGSCRTVPVNNGSNDSTYNGNDTTKNGNANALIVGVVQKGPISPVVQAGVENTAPLPGATIKITGPNGLVISTISDTSGRFTAHVASGMYMLTPQPFTNSTFPIPPEAVTTQVSANATDTVWFEYDTGIR